MRYVRIFSDQQGRRTCASIASPLNLCLGLRSGSPVVIKSQGMPRYGSLSLPPIFFSFPGGFTGKWVLPRPNLIDSDPYPRPMSQGFRVSPKNSSTRSWATLQKTILLSAVARRLRGSSCHRAAVTSFVGLYSDPIPFPPGNLPSQILPLLLPRIPTKFAYISRLTR